jgi:hypothetical protein
MQALVEYVAKALVDNPDAVEITEMSGRSSTTIRLKVAQEDTGRVIGKSGRVANAIRTLLRASASADGRRVNLDIE